jgi:hypothetical protein
VALLAHHFFDLSHYLGLFVALRFCSSLSQSCAWKLFDEMHVTLQELS